METLESFEIIAREYASVLTDYQEKSGVRYLHMKSDAHARLLAQDILKADLFAGFFESVTVFGKVVRLSLQRDAELPLVEGELL